MSNHEESVVAVYATLGQARLAVHILARSGLPQEQVSLVTSHLDGQLDIKAGLQAGEDDIRSAMVGAGLGSLVGVLAGAALVVAGGGIALVLGAMAGLATGGIAGTFLGGLQGWGVHGNRVAHYESLIENGRQLVIAHGDPLEVAKGYRVLKQTAPAELHLYATSDDGESPAPD